MNGTIKITKLDYIRLSNLINSVKDQKSIEIKNMEVLDSEIKRAEQIDSNKIGPEIVTMNSVIEVTDMDTNRKMILKLVYPNEANFKTGSVSILSPVGSALLGYRVNDIVSFEAPKGIKKIRIDKIIYQPEANGEYTV